jgi:hypothetical protein
MTRRRRQARHRASGALRLLSLLIFTKTTTCEPIVRDATPITIDDAGSASDLNTTPQTTSTVPPDLTDNNIPRWTNQDCSGCQNEPTLGKLNNQTYTAVYIPPQTTYMYNISFQFSGVLIFVI